MLLDEFYKYMSTRYHDPDNIFVSAEHSERHQGLKADHIYKVWRIGIDQAKDNLEITTQKSVSNDNQNI